jgi:uncharacterized protein YbbC (DUF1343 family)
VTDRTTFPAVAAGVHLLAAFREAGPEVFAWREPPYEYEDTIPPIDILWGSATLRSGIDSSVPAAEIVSTSQASIEAFLPLRARFLRY